MSLAIAGHMPHLYARDPKPIGVGAKLPDRSYHGPMRTDQGIAKEQRCMFCSAKGHNRSRCPELAQLRNEGGVWVPPKRRAE